MLYAIYRPDGQIVQSNKVYVPDDGKYDAQLDEMGHQFVKAESPGLLPPDHWFVDVSAKEICERPIMTTVDVNKTRVLCGDEDSSLAIGIPKQAKVTITMRDGTQVYPSFVLDAHQLEISIPAPCVYRVHLDLWPYKTFTYEIEAVAS